MTATDEFAKEAYAQLRAIAANHFASEGVDHTLQPTAVVHEAYLRLATQRTAWKNRDHFCAVAATMMRRVLVDHARGRATLSRGGDAKKFALTGLEEAPSATVDVLLLDEALTKLASLHPRHAQVAELRYFGGLTLDECSRALGVSTSTVENDWAMARAWLRRHLEQTSHDPTIG